MNEVYFRQLGP